MSNGEGKLAQELANRELTCTIEMILVSTVS